MCAHSISSASELVLKTKLFFCHAGDKLGTRFARRIEKLFARCVGQKMLLVRRREKRRLVMIEPPRQPLVGAIFEIDDRILVAVKLLAVKSIAGTVHRRRVGNIGIRVDLCPVKFGKDRGRRDSVETVAVIKYLSFI